MKSSVHERAAAVLLSSLTISVAPLVAQTPCVSCAPGTVVDANGVPDANGQFLWYPNYPNGQQSLGDFWACAITRPDGTRRRIHMADPTVIKIGDIYYLSGSSDVARALNFPIYRSTDLVNWKPHMLAFTENYSPAAANKSYYDEIMTGGDLGWATTPPGSPQGWYTTRYPLGDYAQNALGNNLGTNREFVEMFAPHLYIDPSSPSVVYITFNGRTRFWSQIIPSTVFTASMSLCDFIQGGPGRAFGTPGKIGYRQNNTGSTTRFDGGSATTRIPCSGPDADASSTGGTTDWNTGVAGNPFWGSGPGFFQRGRAQWMSIDPYVFFDPAASNRRWMLYTWFGGPESRFSGNNVAGTPMFSNTLADGNTATAGTWFFAYRYHQWYWPGIDLIQNPNAACATWPLEVINNGTSPQPRDGNGVPVATVMLNGMSSKLGNRLSASSGATCASGTETAYGSSYREAICEAPAAFRRENTTYLLYSRNFYDSPAYGIFYRTGAGALSGMGLDISDSIATEYPLVSSWDRQSAGAPNFGHGEVFAGPTGPGEAQQYYLVCHVKLRVPTSNLNAPANSYLARHVTFKRLTFNVNGQPIQQLTNYPPTAAGAGSSADMNGFIVPRYPQ